MFWGVTLETGKRYSQVVDSSYHLSMAALEPLSADNISGRFVSVMIEHNKSEFLLCTLEQNRVLQVHLDHCFVEGEEVTYYITGEGTVHLTGYVITDGDDGAEDSDESEENEGFSNSSLARLSKQTTNHEEESEDEDDQDWRPDMIKKHNPVVSSKNFLKTKDTVHNKKQGPKEKLEKQKKSSPEKTISSIGTKGSEKSQPKAESSDDEDDEDFLMGNDEDDDDDNEEEEEEDDSEDSQENDEDNSEWEDADEDEDTAPVHAVKKAKFDIDVKKNKHPFGTPNLDKSKSPSDAKNHNEKGSHKKSPKLNTSKFSGQKDKADTPKSASGVSPQEVSKPRKSFGGVELQDMVMGNGPIAKSGKMVHVYYRGTLPNNKEFDSCVKGKAFSFRLGKSEVIKGWDVGIQGMKVGGKRKLVIPPSMGYGNKPSGPIPPNSTLHFEVELKAIS